MTIDWKRKLASRKFWVTLAGFIGSLLVVFNVSDNDIAQVTAVITAFASMAIYVLAEASIDKASVGTDKEGDA